MQYIFIKTALVVLVVSLAACGKKKREAVVLGRIEGLAAGEMVSYAPSGHFDQVKTVVAEAGNFELHIPIERGQGDAYTIWFGAQPIPEKATNLYLDSGEFRLIGKDGLLKDITYQGAEEARDYQYIVTSIKKIDAQTVDAAEKPGKVAAMFSKWLYTRTSSGAATFFLDRFRVSKYLPEDSVVVLMKHLTPAAMDNQPGKRLKDWYRDNAKLLMGNPAPDFTQPDTSGKPVSLKNFRGKYVLVDFWASWCVPCRAENPNVVKAYEQYKDKGFTVLGVSLDNASGKVAWLNAIHKDGLSWTHVADLKSSGNAAAKLYNVKAIPSNFLIDPNGIIVARNLRGEALQNKLKQLFSN